MKHFLLILHKDYSLSMTIFIILLILVQLPITHLCVFENSFTLALLLYCNQINSSGQTFLSLFYTLCSFVYYFCTSRWFFFTNSQGPVDMDFFFFFFQHRAQMCGCSANTANFVDNYRSRSYGEEKQCISRSHCLRFWRERKCISR